MYGKEFLCQSLAASEYHEKKNWYIFQFVTSLYAAMSDDPWWYAISCIFQACVIVCILCRAFKSIEKSSSGVQLVLDTSRPTTPDSDTSVK